MLIYLVRHGDALAGLRDDVRPLSQKGIDDLKRVAKFLRKAKIEPEAIYHSGLLRAEQTAEILLHDLDLKCLLIKKDNLKPEDPVELMLAEIYNLTGPVMIVGHNPYLSNLLSRLIVGTPDPQIADFKKGTVVCLEKRGKIFYIKWFITPKIV